MFEGKYLITTDRWFYAPNGQLYNAAWGAVVAVEDSALGIKTNRNSANWYLRVGDEGKCVYIAGCQVHYAVRCDEKPNDGPRVNWVQHNGHVATNNDTPSAIYIAE